MNKTYVKKVLAVAVILLFFSVSVIPSTGTTDVKQITIPTSSGNTLYVGGNGTGNYTKIQDAIDDASDGDTVFVYNGTYYENLEIDKSINLIGEDKYETIIIGDYKGTVIYIYSDRVNINGFTIKNGSQWGFYADTKFSNISNNIITNNVCDGILMSGDSSNNIVSKNYVVDNFYGGVILAYSSDNIIYENEIINNGWRGSSIIWPREGIGLYYGSNRNKIYRNNISINNNFGINVTSSCLNFIHQNNFLKNPINAIFVNSFFNHWSGNYWDNWMGFGPKLIFGRLGPFGKIPWINFDWRPAREPYDIEV